VTDIPNFEQLTGLERMELAEELIASVRNPEAAPWARLMRAFGTSFCRCCCLFFRLSHASQGP